MQTPLKLITHLFPVWALVLSAIAFYFPAPFVALKPGIIPLRAVNIWGHDCMEAGVRATQEAKAESKNSNNLL